MAIRLNDTYAMAPPHERDELDDLFRMTERQPNHPLRKLVLATNSRAVSLEDENRALKAAIRQLNLELEEARRDAKEMREAAFKVCEGWTLPGDARKVLETALWSNDAAQSKGSQKEVIFDNTSYAAWIANSHLYKG